MPEYREGVRRNHNQDDPELEKYRKLFIGGLSFETNEDGLRKHFEQWGDIVDCVVMRDQATRKSRGFGFITYKVAAYLDEGQKNRPHKIDGREVETKRAMPRDEAESQASVKKLFVGGLKEDTTEEQIRNFFSQFGKIESIDMIIDKETGKRRGFCFVTFDDYDPVDKLVLKKYHEVNGKKIEVKKALSKSEITNTKMGNSGIGPTGRGRGRMGGDGGMYSSRGGGDWGGPQNNFAGGYGNFGGSGGYNQGMNQGGGSWGGPGGGYAGSGSQGGGFGPQGNYGGSGYGPGGYGGGNYGSQNIGGRYNDNFGGGYGPSNYSGGYSNRR